MKKTPVFYYDMFSNPKRTRLASRQFVDWSKIPDGELINLIQLLTDHHSPYTDDAVQELARRATDGFIVPVPDLSKPPQPVLDELPYWLTVFPFSLLCKQFRHR